MLCIGVLGAGHLGKIHLRLLKELGNVALVGFFDHNTEVSKQIAEEMGITAFESAEDLIDACDAIDIVTPTVAHYEYAVKAIKKSKHIFIEKPVTSTVKEARKLLKLAGEADIKVQIGHVERFNPAFLAAKDHFNNPMFIETHRLAEFNPRGTDVSVVHDLMIHDIDIVLSVVKSSVKSINASGVAVVSDTPDIANARIEFDNGCVANLTASRISLKNMRKSRFFQRDAYIAVDFLKKKTDIVRLKNLSGEPGPLDVTIDLGKGKGSKLIYFESPEMEPNNAIQMELKLFIESILENTTTAVTLEDGCNALDVAHQVMEKLNNTLNVLI
jgi:predicted dehydrogenase